MTADYFPKSSNGSDFGDGFLVNANYQRAITIRMKLKDYLRVHQATNQKYSLFVDYLLSVDTWPQYCLRVLDKNNKVILELRDPTPTGLMSDRNLALLLILYQS